MANVLGLVSFRVFPTHMGGQKGVAVFYQYLQQQLDVLLAGSTDNEDSGKVRMERILFPNKKIYKNIFRIKKLARLIQSNNIEIIIAEHSYTGWIAWLLQKKTGIPFIIHSHNIESKRFQKMNKWLWKAYHWYEGWIHRKAQHNFFISKEDEDFAIKEFHLDALKCSVVTYGVESKFVQKDKPALKKEIGADENKIILLFNGTLDYEPNYDAVVTIIDTIEPLLQKKLENFQIIITGNRMPEKLAEKILSAPNLIYTGYVEDVDLYYQSAAIFINPVANDTGVKTKLIEAVANNCTAVSTESGASGIKKEFCGNKLITVADGDWNAFVDRIIEQTELEFDTPQSFYDYYDWKNITAKAAQKINEAIKNDE